MSTAGHIPRQPGPGRRPFRPTGDLDTEVCVVGAGPAGLALAVGLARRGCSVVVLEHSADGAIRAFRGESVSPDGVWLLDRLGVLDRLRPGAVEVRRLEIGDGGRTVLDADFDEFPYHYRHPLEIAQPRLLAALAEEARSGGDATVLSRWSVTGLRWEDGPGSRVAGVHARTPGGDRTVRARLVVGADGRFSTVRRLAGLRHRTTALGRDVVWFTLPFPDGWDRAAYRIRMRGNHNAIFLPGTDGRVRVGFSIPKGGLRALRAEGITALHRRIAELAPELAESTAAHLASFRNTALLDIFTTEVPRWSLPGLVLIGDAAHTLSPVLGQGVNHALADADALAPLAAAVVHLPSASPGAALAQLQRFQRQREGDLSRSRALQLRQERVFGFAAPPAVALRQAVYRAMHHSRALRRRVLEPAYFPAQRRAGEHTGEHAGERAALADARAPDPRSTP